MPPANQASPALSRFWWRALALWVLIAAAEVVHGVLRAIWLVPFVGAQRSNQIGVFTGALIILLIAGRTIRWLIAAYPTAGWWQLLGVGAVWTMLMLTFEWTAGHYAFGRSWEDLARDYRIAEGGLLGLGMLVLFLSPLLAARRGR